MSDFILRLKCNDFDFVWSFTTDTLGELTVRPLAIFKSLLLRDGKGKRWKKVGATGR